MQWRSSKIAYTRLRLSSKPHNRTLKPFRSYSRVQCYFVSDQSTLTLTNADVHFASAPMWTESHSYRSRFTEVNAGPIAICETFLAEGNAAQHDPAKVERLRKLMAEFVEVRHLSLLYLLLLLLFCFFLCAHHKPFIHNRWRARHWTQTRAWSDQTRFRSSSASKKGMKTWRKKSKCTTYYQHEREKEKEKEIELEHIT